MKSILPLLGLTSVLLLNSCGGLPLPPGGTDGDKPSGSAAKAIDLTGNRVFSDQNAPIYGSGDLGVTLTGAPSAPAGWRISAGEITPTEGGAATIPYSALNQKALDGVKPVTISALDSKGGVILSREVRIDDHAPDLKVPDSTGLSETDPPLVLSVTDAGSGLSTLGATCSGEGQNAAGCGVVDSAAGTVTFKHSDLIKTFPDGAVTVSVTGKDRVGNTLKQNVAVTLSGASTQQAVAVSGQRIYSNEKDAAIYGNGPVTLKLTRDVKTTVNWKITAGEVIAEGNGQTATVPYSALNKIALDGAAPVTVSAIDENKKVIASVSLLVDDRAPSVTPPADTALNVKDTPIVYRLSDNGGSGVAVFAVTCSQADIKIEPCGTQDAAAGTVSIKPSELTTNFMPGKITVSIASTDRVGNAGTYTGTLSAEEAGAQGKINITGQYVMGDQTQFYGGEALTLSLQGTRIAPTDIAWTSTLGEVQGAGYSASIPYSEKNKNALRGGPVTYTARTISTNTVIAEGTFNVDDAAPQTLAGGGGQPLKTSLLWVETLGDGTEVPHLINPMNYFGAGVRFRVQYTDEYEVQDKQGHVTRLPGSGLIPPRLDAYRSGVLLKRDVQSTSDLIEGSGYTLRANSIADRLGNRVADDALDLASFLYDNSAPGSVYTSDFGLLLREKRAKTPKSEAQEENQIVFTATDADLDDRTPGSGPAGISARCWAAANPAQVVSPCGKLDRNALNVTLSDSLLGSLPKNTTVVVEISTIDRVGSLLNAKNPDLSKHTNATRYNVVRQ